MQTYELNTARNCLRVIINTYGIKEIFIPYYICPTVWQACREENCKVKFYHIDDDFYPTEEFNKNSYILYPNYFGINSQNIIKLSSIYPNLIVDNAHAFYMEHYGLASFCSYRKFFDVADGAKLIINKKINLPEDDYEYKEIPKNYEEFVKNELRLNNEPPKFISKCTKKAIQNIDFNIEKAKRLEKFYNFDKKLNQTNQLKIKLSDLDVPFVYPYLTEKEYKTDIILYRYWNPLPKDFSEYKYYKYFKPLPLNEKPFRK